MEVTDKCKPERKEVAYFMKRLYKHGLTTTSGGNISFRVSEDIVLITPSATDKGRMNWTEIGILTTHGENLTPNLVPSMETAMHLAIYERRKDVKSIVHAHPVFASLFTAIKTRINTSLTAEARAILGDPVFVRYEVMGSSALAEIASENILKSDILLLENHGILTTGTNLLQAFDRIEVLENAAKMTFLSEIIGGKKPLDKARILELERLFR